MYHWYIKINEAYKLNHIINIEAVYPSDTIGTIVVRIVNATTVHSREYIPLGCVV